MIAIGEGLENEALLVLADALGWDAVLAPSPDDIPPPDFRTAVVVKAHKIGRDLAALKALLKLPIPYIGLMGPARRKQTLLSALFDEGLVSPNTSLSRLFGPSGLDVGAETPAEIALSIVAEIQAVMTGHPGGSLRDKAGADSSAGSDVKTDRGMETARRGDSRGRRGRRGWGGRSNSCCCSTAKRCCESPRAMCSPRVARRL